ncbi:MAG: hypothetical protein RIB79_02480 [Allomuricauda sp.]|jgi:hypothetical protein
MTKKKNTESIVKDIKRKTRRKFSAEEKIRIVLEGLKGEESVSNCLAISFFIFLKLLLLHRISGLIVGLINYCIFLFGYEQFRNKEWDVTYP